ncbi:hypothetical protein D9619_002016 [Psilocybe cf. subviscida]|uniref:Xylanolytic transcriptional activator regulatory domain-containing protein n=1 Tax=Psilocybe cf. subviscida TaxID=2480587 RepID=A0A8H5BG40_9AGAR|nr:hypothetical protein D9619_002016 [Psilocybe cf. subviscida]
MENHTDTNTSHLKDSKDLDEHEPKPKRRRLHGACDACRRKKIKSTAPRHNQTDAAIVARPRPNVPIICRGTPRNRKHRLHTSPGWRRQTRRCGGYYTRHALGFSILNRLGPATYHKPTLQSFCCLSSIVEVYTGKDLQLLLEKPLDELPYTPSTHSQFTQSQSPCRSGLGPGSSPAPSISTPSSMSSVKLPKVSSLSQEMTHLSQLTSDVSSEDDEEDDEEDFAHLELAEHLKELSIEVLEDRFYGRSSAFMFFKEAAALRGQLAGMPSTMLRRPVYWDVQPWELDYTALPSHPPLYDYPPDDLLRSLVFIYFEKFNPLFPLLHKPTFTRMLADGRHMRDQDFGMVVLMVCALASRYSHDPRVFSPEDADGEESDGKGKGLSSGWKYFRQVPMYRKGLLYRAGLFDLQYYVLATMYLVGASVPQNSWNIVGILVRYLLEMGGHRRKPHSQKPSPEDELMKRVFWCVLYLDRIISSFLGRPCLIQDEDYDIDFPIECDDEYWDPPFGGSPDDAFKQPPGKPSYITAFVCTLKLAQILGLSLRTLYATKKAKALSGMVGGEWEQRIVAELDSSLNKWRDSVPGFLQWDPEREDLAFFHQSVSIYALFYYVQRQIHRPFLMKKTPLSLPSLAMCTNAARSCARLLEVSLTRGMRVMPTLIVSAFCAGTVIVLNLWGIRHSGLLGDAAKETVNLQKCINVLKECEKRWHVAGRSCDMLKEAASLGDYDATAALPKRRREEPPTSAPVPQHQHTTSAQPQHDADTKAFLSSNPIYNPTQPARSGPGQNQISMAHSMAITPVASMSGAASILSLAPGPAVSAPGASMHSYNPAPNPLATDWDLGNLLMMQMGYSHYGPNAPLNMGQGLAGQQVHGAAAQMQQALDSTANNNSLPQQVDMTTALLQQAATALQSPIQSGGRQENALSASPESLVNTEDLLSLFSDVPMAFSLEEWDAYLASINS